MGMKDLDIPDPVFLHVGLHKTGSTFLQNKVFPQVEANLISQPRVDYLALSRDYDPVRFRVLLAGQAQLRPGRPTIISQEVLTGRALGSPGWNPLEMAHRLHAAFPRAKVLLVLRSQPSYILSLYCFRVVQRGLEYRSLSSYLERYFEPALRPKLNYHHLVECYRDLFGVDHFRVMAYEQLGRDPCAFVKSILDFMGVDGNISLDYRPVNRGTRQVPVVAVNRVVNLPVETTAQLLQRWGLLSYPAYVSLAKLHYAAKARLLMPLLGRVLGKEQRTMDIPPRWQERIHRSFAPSNHALGRLTGLDLEGMGYPW